MTSQRPAVTLDHIAQQIASEDACDRAARYGAHVTPLTAETVAAREAIDYSKPKTWLGDRNLVKITVIRLLGFNDDAACPFIDVSYVYGELADGTPVRVDLGRHQFAKRQWKSQLIECFKAAGRFGKAMGVDVNDPHSVSRG